jgi:hypothetical protein
LQPLLTCRLTRDTPAIPATVTTDALGSDVIRRVGLVALQTEQRNEGFSGIHFPSQCSARTAHMVPTDAICSR